MAREVRPNFKKTPPRPRPGAGRSGAMREIGADGPGAPGDAGSDPVADARTEAETIGLLALAFVVEDDENLLTRFLALSGLQLDDLRDRAQDPVLLGAVLDFLLAHEPDLVAFATANAMEPQTVGAMRRLLPGGDVEG